MFINVDQGFKYCRIPKFISDINIANTTQYDRDDTDDGDMTKQNSRWTDDTAENS